MFCRGKTDWYIPFIITIILLPTTDCWPTFLICRHIFCGWMESSAGDMWKVDSSLCSVPRKIFQLWVRQNGNWETCNIGAEWWEEKRLEHSTDRGEKVTRKVAIHDRTWQRPVRVCNFRSCSMCKKLAFLIKMLFYIFHNRIAPGTAIVQTSSGLPPLLL